MFRRYRPVKTKFLTILLAFACACSSPNPEADPSTTDPQSTEDAGAIECPSKVWSIGTWTCEQCTCVDAACLHVGADGTVLEGVCGADLLCSAPCPIPTGPSAFTPPWCQNGTKGHAETGIDCGGGVKNGCPPCADGQTCLVDADCVSGHCVAPSDTQTGICQP